LAISDGLIFIERFTVMLKSAIIWDSQDAVDTAVDVFDFGTFCEPAHKNPQA
jgi:hypothetical protein